jgi:hypothetical protein
MLNRSELPDASAICQYVGQQRQTLEEPPALSKTKGVIGILQSKTSEGAG